MTPVEIYRESVRATLEADLPYLGLGLLIVTVGLGALAVYALRRPGRDRAVALFGLFALLYGSRLLLDTQTIPFILRMPDVTSDWIRQMISYVLPFTGTLFGYAIFITWRRYIRWLVAVWGVFAVLAIIAALVSGNPAELHTANNVLNLAAWVSFAFAIYHTRGAMPELRLLRWTVALFGVTVVLGNLRGLGAHLPFDPEPFGFACFLAALAHVLVLRAFRNGEQLREVNQELEIATRIQQSILPQPVPDSTDLKIAAQYLPMTSVAGDFYEFLRVDELHIGILIADVSGHGVPAALIASMVKVAIAAQLPHAQDPAKVLSGMNRILCGKMQCQFVSAAYLFLDMEERRFRYSAGGHPPMLWWKADERRIQKIEENGLLSGIMPHAPYTAMEHEIGRGDRFLLYTDGLAEGADASGEFFGDKHLEQALIEDAGLSGSQCAEDLLARLRRFAGYDRGGAQDDDLTVLVIDTP